MQSDLVPAGAVMVLQDQETGQRYGVDGRDTVGYPLVPIGDRVTQGVSESGDERRISYPAIGWQIVHPAAKPGERLPASSVLDVYVGLMFLYAVAGFPESGEVRFSRYEFLQLIGWLSSGSANGVGPSRPPKPSGRHYEQLKAALTYLSGTRFVNENPNAPQIGLIDGKPFKGAQGFPILQYFQLVDDPTGPRPEGKGFPSRCLVIFSRAFVTMLAGGARTASFDLDLFLQLPTGTPRHLVRLFAYMWQEGIDTMPIAEVFQRIGSTQTECVPARAKQILTKAHLELRRRGILTQEPEFLKDAVGRWAIKYHFADPEAVLSAEEVLVNQAIAYGVAPAAARELVIAHRAQFERVLAAVTLGLLQPKKTIPALIVHYTRRGHDILETGQRAGEQLDIELQTPEIQYIAWTVGARAARLAKRPDIDPVAIRAAIASHPTFQAAGHPDWVLDGLVQIHLNQALGIEGFREFRAGVVGAGRED